MEEVGKKILNGEIEETDEAVWIIKDMLSEMFSLYDRVVKEAEQNI